MTIGQELGILPDMTDDDDGERSRASSTRLLIVDNRPLVRWALTHIAAESDDLTVVSESDSDKGVLDLVFAVGPDVATVHCSLADDAGWRLVATLRERHPALGLVILCTDSSDDLILRALDSGASAFLPKVASVHEVVAAIRHASVSPTSFTATGLAQAIRRRSQGVSATSAKLTLSARERQVLVLLREGHSVPEVAATLFVSLSTAKTYVARIYEKLGANNRAQALMTAVQQGLFQEEALVS